MNTLYEELSLRIPGRSQYISVARLAVAGFASEQDVSLDEIEDLKLAVAEACGQVLLHASNLLNFLVECRLEDQHLELVVRGVTIPSQPTASATGPEPDTLGSGRRETGETMGIFLIEALMDEVSLETEGDGPLVRMKRRLGAEIYGG